MASPKRAPSLWERVRAQKARPEIDAIGRMFVESMRRPIADARRYAELARWILENRGKRGTAATADGFVAARRATDLIREAVDSHHVDPGAAREKAWSAARLWRVHRLRLSVDAPEKITKLLMLAGDSDTITEEAKNAAITAAQRMRKHGITFTVLPGLRVSATK